MIYCSCFRMFFIVYNKYYYLIQIQQINYCELLNDEINLRNNVKQSDFSGFLLYHIRIVLIVLYKNVLKNI